MSSYDKFVQMHAIQNKTTDYKVDQNSNKMGAYQEAVQKNEKLFNFIKYSDYFSYGATAIIILISLFKDYHEFKKSQNANRMLFNFGFLILCTAVGSVLGAGVGINLLGELRGQGLGSFLGSFLALKLKNTFHI